MNNQAKDLKLEKDKERLSQTGNEKSTKRELENSRKKEASCWREQDLLHANILSAWVFFNLKVDIFFVTLNKLNILLELHFDLHRSLIDSLSTVLLVSKIKWITLNIHIFKNTQIAGAFIK